MVIHFRTFKTDIGSHQCDFLMKLHEENVLSHSYLVYHSAILLFQLLVPFTYMQF